MKLFTFKSDSEDDLIEGCIAGKREKQRLLYEKYSKRMMAVCLRYTRTTFEAEDVMQEAWVKVFTNLKNFKRDCPLEAWIRRIMVNTSLNHYRTQHLTLTVLEPDTSETMPGEELVFANYGLEQLLELIKGLAPRYQMIFNLYAIEGYTHPEIAKQLGISEGTSKSQYSRARAILQQALERQEKKYNEKVIY